MVRRIPMLFMVGDFATEDFVAKRNKWSLLIASFWFQSDAHAQPRSGRPAMVAGPLLLPILAALLRSVEGFSSKWWPSSAHCVTGTSWTERVAARINELTRYLFGRHVLQCAEMDPVRVRLGSSAGRWHGGLIFLANLRLGGNRKNLAG